MTNEFKRAIGLVSAGARGGEIPGLSGAADWERVIALCREQSALSLAAYGLQFAGEGCPEEIRRREEAKLKQTALRNVMKKRMIVQLLARMERAGIRCAVLKGFAVGEFYKAPECRVSSDADLWINPKDEERACAFLEGEGFAVEPRWKNGHHAVCTHPQMGVVELHVILYDEIVEEIWFGRMDGSEFVQEPFCSVKTPFGEYFTLGATDHLIFLALHMVKHFIIGGMSLRQLTDLAVYFAGNRETVDPERFWKTIDSLQYARLVNCALWAMVLHGGFSEADFPGLSKEPPAQLDQVLADLEKGGWLGFNNDVKVGIEGFNEYNRQMMLKNKKPWQYKLYMVLWTIHLPLIFPKKEDLAKRYPYVMKYPFLIPFAWAHRLLFRGLRFLLRGKGSFRIAGEETPVSDDGRKRIELFRSLGMM